MFTQRTHAISGQMSLSPPYGPLHILKYLFSPLEVYAFGNFSVPHKWLLQKQFQSSGNISNEKTCNVINKNLFPNIFWVSVRMKWKFQYPNVNTTALQKADGKWNYKLNVLWHKQLFKYKYFFHYIHLGKLYENLVCLLKATEIEIILFISKEVVNTMTFSYHVKS